MPPDNETLSQEEIDALLHAMEAGSLNVSNVNEEEDIMANVREYNFRRPMKFSKEQLRTLQLIHENYARDVSTYLSSRARTYVNVTFASVDQITFSEFQQSLTSPTFISVFSTDILPGSAVFQMGLDIGYVLVDKLLGGPGIPLETLRTPTELELSILRKEGLSMIKALSKAWTTIVPFDTILEKTEFNPQFVQIAAPNEMTVLITLSINFRDIQGFINVCWPSSLLEPINEKLTTRLWSPDRKTTQKQIEKLKNSVLMTKADVKAVLGETTIQLQDFLNIDVGDVIRLNSFNDEPINVTIQDTPVFKGMPGIYKGYYAVNIEKEDPDLLEKVMVERYLEGLQ